MTQANEPTIRPTNLRNINLRNLSLYLLLSSSLRRKSEEETKAEEQANVCFIYICVHEGTHLEHTKETWWT